MSSASELIGTISDVASDLMMVDGPDSDEIGDVREGIENVNERFSVLRTLEDDTETIDEILTTTDDVLNDIDSLTDGDFEAIDDFLESLRDRVTELEEQVRDYAETVDADSEPEESSADTEESGKGWERGELEDLEYDELQDIAKQHDIKANQSADDLVDAILNQSSIQSDDEKTQDTEGTTGSGPSDSQTESIEQDEMQTDPSAYDEELFYDFFSEATEHIDSFEDVLLTLEEDRDMDALNQGFRGMHSIKGAAGFLDLRWINNLSHAMEDLLGLFRDEGYKINESHIELLFGGMDSLKKLINTHHETIESGEPRTIKQKQYQDEISRLRQSIEELKDTGDKVEDTDEEDDEPETGDDVELRETESIRVDTEKIDSLVNRAGELVTTFNQLKRGENQTNGSQSREQRQMYNQMDRLVSELQEDALSLRMVPLKKSFSKARRMVRDLSKQFGKEVNLIIEGEETELDRSLVEKIQDPLVHLIRNAIDHGIEEPDAREEKGKDPEGTLKLSAYHESGDVVIEISDDGAGIDSDEIFDKAVENDVISPDEELSEKEIYMLLFEPGFSTTEEVTDVSGRGVGMDVVRKNVESIRGSIEVESEIDEGSTFRLNIPLTLSIIDGMIMKLGTQRFVIPVTNIMRSLSPNVDQITTVEGRGEVLNLRGELISLCRLNQLFNLDVDDRSFQDSLIVIVKGGNQKVGLQVDDILGQQEVVIKSLGLAFESLRGVSGAAILGDGEVGLILDTKTLEEIAG